MKMPIRNEAYSAYQIDQSAVEVFDRTFEKKQKCKTDFHQEFQILLSLVYKEEC